MSVCASISGNITLDIPSVSASLTIFRAEQSGIIISCIQGKASIHYVFMHKAIRYIKQ